MFVYKIFTNSFKDHLFLKFWSLLKEVKSHWSREQLGTSIYELGEYDSRSKLSSI